MNSITVIGTGFYKNQLTLEAVDLLNGASQIILHTARCGVTEYLDEKNIPYSSLDELYDTHEDFDEHAEAAAEAVEAAAKAGDVVYCVMDIRDLSACILAERGADIIPGPPGEGILFACASDGTQFYSASDWEDMHPDASLNTIVREIDSRELSCEVKLRLMESYPDDAECMIVSHIEAKYIELHELDRQQGYDHRFSVFVRAEKDASRLNDISLRGLIACARTNNELYKEGDFSSLSDDIARISGAIAYAEDRGEFTAADIAVDARDVILG